ncbi:hypothetical protein [Spongiibacter sp. IMCC21906]|uniref:hypothetical protein n=1 Tax=Spongiibacter sp. IMCC21906 TaxID=1620392 RepID=UPI00062E5F78|nr:hypothetical protein [Spongiibacter sp. IMCC21906]
MQILLIILFTVLVLTLGYLWMRLRAQQVLLAELQLEQQTLAKAWQSQPIDFEHLKRASIEPLICIKILNPVELASKESVFAGPISSVAPDVIRRKVYKRTGDILREELQMKGVQTEIQLYGLD